MNIGKPRKLGKTIEEIEEGDSLSLTESIEDQQLLLYLGLTNDANPLFIQHDYAQQTEFERPIVPMVMLSGIIASAISKHLPGPGSHIVNFSMNLIEPIYLEGNNQECNRVRDSVVMVQPPLIVHPNTENQDELVNE